MITASNITNSSAFLTWSSGFPLTGHREVPLKLSGYFLTGMSLGHTFQKILEPTLTEYNLSCLKPWTEYNITLRRFYPNNGNIDRPMRIGRAAAVTLRTHPYGKYSHKFYLNVLGGFVVDKNKNYSTIL